MRDYYTALNEQRYDDAWAVLTPAIRSRFGGFERWKAGYAKTLSSKPKDLVTTLKGDRMVVRLRLAALEEGCPSRATSGDVDARARGRRVDRHRAGRSVARRLLLRIEMSMHIDIGRHTSAPPVERASCVAPGTRVRPWTVFPPAPSGATQGARRRLQDYNARPRRILTPGSAALVSGRSQIEVSASRRRGIPPDRKR